MLLPRWRLRNIQITPIDDILQLPVRAPRDIKTPSKTAYGIEMRLSGIEVAEVPVRDTVEKLLLQELAVGQHFRLWIGKLLS